MSLVSVAAILLALTLLISAVGFYRLVYFISVGYAFSIVAMAVATPILLRDRLTWAALAQNALLILWGLRLGLYLIRRETAPAFRKQAAEVHERNAGVRLSRKLLIWAGVSLLYVAMFSPSLFHLANTSFLPSPLAGATQIVGLSIMAGGLGLEALADRQKAAFKARFPSSFCDIGLYTISRCPNYLGEIFFWAGNWIVGLAFYVSLLMGIISLIGLICIVLIMMGSTKRLEKAQTERYGDLTEYQAYVKSVPVLFPFIPVYSLQNVRVYLE
jgi:steroid 5-alpha reductase family enzyme